MQQQKPNPPSLQPDAGDGRVVTEPLPKLVAKKYREVQVKKTRTYCILCGRDDCGDYRRQMVEAEYVETHMVEDKA